MPDKKWGPHGEGCECPEGAPDSRDMVKIALRQADNYHRLFKWSLDILDHYSGVRNGKALVNEAGLTDDEFTDFLCVCRTLIRKGEAEAGADALGQTFLLGLAVGIVHERRKYLAENQTTKPLEE